MSGGTDSSTGIPLDRLFEAWGTGGSIGTPRLTGMDRLTLSAVPRLGVGHQQFTEYLRLMLDAQPEGVAVQVPVPSDSRWRSRICRDSGSSWTRTEDT